MVNSRSMGVRAYAPSPRATSVMTSVRTAPQIKLKVTVRTVVVTACSRFRLSGCTLAVRSWCRRDARAEQEHGHQCDQDDDLQLNHVRTTSRQRALVTHEGARQ